MATLQQDRDFMSVLYGVSLCGTEDITSPEDVDEAIEYCKAMLDNSIDRGDKEEISYWRKLLQENKVYRRKMLTT